MDRSAESALKVQRGGFSAIRWWRIVLRVPSMMATISCLTFSRAKWITPPVADRGSDLCSNYLRIHGGAFNRTACPLCRSKNSAYASEKPQWLLVFFCKLAAPKRFSCGTWCLRLSHVGSFERSENDTCCVVKTGIFECETKHSQGLRDAGCRVPETMSASTFLETPAIPWDHKNRPKIANRRRLTGYRGNRRPGIPVTVTVCLGVCLVFCWFFSLAGDGDVMRRAKKRRRLHCRVW